MRTLVVSDLHLGLGPRQAVLEVARPRERLLDALDGVDRLVLLGDIVELVVRPARRSLGVAEPVLRAVAERLDEAAEVIIVPGNHDRPLVRSWLRGRRDELDVATEVPLDASPELSRLSAWLGAGRVRASYPGVYLQEGVWATHGHYLDRHLLPDSSWGVRRGMFAEVPASSARPEDYEPLARSTSAEPTAARQGDLQSREGGLESRGGGLGQLLRRPLEGVADVARAVTMPLAPGRLLSPPMAPVVAPLLSFQMRHASLPAMSEVVDRLGVQAHTVLFGHVHRRGPLPEDDPEQWQASAGGPRLFNCGCWQYEPLLLYRAVPPHPYWPGGALEIIDGEVRTLGLLDDLLARQVRGPARSRETAR